MVSDPRGVTWCMTLSNEMVRTELIEHALAVSGMTERAKRKRRRRYGVGIQGNRLGGWSRAEATAWIVHADAGDTHKAWLSPACSKRAALADLHELASAIQTGDEPAPSHA
jgi:hypothetical protein